MKKLSALLLAVVLSVMFVGCGDSKDLNESQTLDSNDSQGESSADSHTNLDKSAQKDLPKDFIVDCDKCVIQVGFTEDEIDRFKKEWGEYDFYVIADDAHYYAATLREYLEANGIKSEYASRFEEHYTRIVFPNESIDVTRLDSLYEFYLYQKGKKPKKLEDTVVFEDEINEYFGITNPKDSQNSHTFTEALSDEDAKTRLDEIKEYMSFIVSPQGFNALDALTYDSAKVQVDENNGLEFIDLCKHRVVAGVKYQSVFEGETYDSNCIVSDTHSEGELDGLRKYFIKAKSIDEAFGLHYKTKDKAPKGNVYTYCCDEGLKEDGVGSWFIWENGRLWIKGSGYDGGDATIFTQKGDFVEVIYRWTIAG